MEKDEEGVEEAERWQYHPSHSISYGDTLVYCVSCGATGEQLFEECPKPIDFEALAELLRRWESEEGG